MTDISHPLNWETLLSPEKKADYFKKILDFIKKERIAGKSIYPLQKDIFNALKYTAYENTKVVILGQDPYHGPQQAHGLCFSVRPTVPIPPSLENIFQELNNDLGCEIPQHGCLTAWAEQGVLLLNTILSVERGKAGSHAQIGWQQFTDKIIDSLNQHPKGIVFLLWGSQAQSKIPLIDATKHRILKAPHPSPLSAHRGFFHCGHFSKANAWLQKRGRGEVNWNILNNPQ